MKIAIAKQKAFTLVELMTSIGLLTLVVIAVLACNLTGLKIAKISQVQMQASTDSHMVMGMLMKETRGAYSLQVGTNTSGVFAAVPDGRVQAGTALQVYPTNDTTIWICYYYVPASNALFRAQNGLAAKRVISSLTNSLPIFAFEDFAGNSITNTTPSFPALVSVNLRFASTVASLGTNLLSTNYYSVRTKLTPRRT